MKYFCIFAISLLIHFFLGFSAYYFGDASQNKTRQLVEISIPENKENSLSKQMVRESEQPKKEKPKYDLKPRFFSDTTKYTEQETRAALSGMTQNRSAQKSQAKAQAQNHLTSPEKNGDLPKSKPLPLPNPSVEGNPPLPTPGTSTVGETMPKDIKIGTWTSLNTERYLYYTFFARIEERVRFHWERAVREAAQYVPTKKLVSQVWTTDLEVILDRKGHFERVILHKRSGIDSFDQAAVNAFRIGSPYLNPPQELVQGDERLHLKYEITVSYVPQERM